MIAGTCGAQCTPGRAPDDPRTFHSAGLVGPRRSRSEFWKPLAANASCEDGLDSPSEMSSRTWSHQRAAVRNPRVVLRLEPKVLPRDAPKLMPMPSPELAQLVEPSAKAALSPRCFYGRPLSRHLRWGCWQPPERVLSQGSWWRMKI